MKFSIISIKEIIWRVYLWSPLYSSIKKWNYFSDLKDYKFLEMIHFLLLLSLKKIKVFSMSGK